MNPNSKIVYLIDDGLFPSARRVNEWLDARLCGLQDPEVDTCMSTFDEEDTRPLLL